MIDTQLQETWDKLNSTLKKQKLINDKIIMDIIKIKFSNKMKSIIKYESIGTIVLFIAAIMLIWNIQIFDTLPLKITVVISLIIMLSLPILSLSSIYQMKNMNMSARNCKKNVVEYTKRQSRFLLIQQWSVVISPILMLIIIPPFLKLTKGIDFFAGDSNNLLWYLPIALIALIFFGKWGYGCYIRITNDAKKILQELEGDNS